MVSSPSRPLLGRALFLAACCVLCGTFPAEAQNAQKPGRTFRGLFGGNARLAGEGRSVTVHAMIAGAYDDNLLAAARGSDSARARRGRFQRSGFFSGVQAGLNYTEPFSQGTFSTSVSSRFRYYPALGELTTLSHAARARFDTQLTRRISLDLGQNVAYGPQFQLGLLSTSGFEDDEFVPEDAGLEALVADEPEFVVSERRRLRSTSSVGVGYDLSRRLSAHVSYRYRRSYALDGDADDFGYHRYRASMDYRFSRYGTVFIGYSARQVSYPGADLWAHQPVAGVRYGRGAGIRFGRTTVTLHAGTAFTSRDDRQRLQATGSAAIHRDLGRSWSAQARYSRGLVLIEHFDEPFFADSIVGSIGGQISDRLTLSALSGYSTGSLNRRTSRRYDVYATSVRAQLALSRYIAAYGQGIYYSYQFPSDVPLPDDVHGEMQRRGVRMGITAWVPLVKTR